MKDLKKIEKQLLALLTQVDTLKREIESILEGKK